MKTMANNDAIAVTLQKICMSEKQRPKSSTHKMTTPALRSSHRAVGELVPGGTASHVDQELRVSLNGTDMNVLGITPRRRGMVIVWHEIDGARS